MSNFLNWIVENPGRTGIAVATLVVVLGLFVYGIGDLVKFSPRRVWAIGGVVFRESIRRKVLWLTPLVMLGIVALTGVQQPDDPLDAIRQTLQFSLFASGLLVVISGVMLSCTNLPRDIETKVIFTIVTKPTTRLEIILGKIIGFARVTGSILILMGVFTWGYVHVRAWQLGRDIDATLKMSVMDNEFARGRFEHLNREGLLDTRNLAFAGQIETVAKEPEPGSPIRWFSTSQTASVPFNVKRETLVPQGFADPAKGETPPNPGDAGVIVRVTMRPQQVGKVEVAKPVVQGPMLPDDSATPASPYGEPSFTIRFSDTYGDFDLIPAEQINGGKSYTLKPGPDGTSTLDVRIDEKVAPALANQRNWSVVIAGSNENFLLGIEPGAVSVIVPGNGPQNFQRIDALTDGKTPLLFTRGGAGRSGRLLEGPSENFHAVTIAHFKGAEPRPGSDGTVALELAMDIERLDDDSNEQTTQIEVDVSNPSAGKSFDKIYLTPEKLKTVYADVPAEAFAGGTFDVGFAP